ncbi:helix-hairpin-helix domain-containing protein [Chitinophagaceae bacterium MMS25-I14]
MTNYEIADQFSLLSKLMDIHGENSFKAKSYSIAAFNIEKLPQELSLMDDAGIAAMKGIGDTLGKKIREILDTGKLQALEEVILKTPPGILDMMQIKGLGPKKIATIWKELGVESVGELEYACNENRLVTLKGFGAKTQEGILKIIAFIRSNQGYHLWAEVHEFAQGVLASLQKQFPQHIFDFTGQYRRQLPTLECVEIITDAPLSGLETFFSVTAADNILIITAEGQPELIIYSAGKEEFHTQQFRTSASEDFLAAFNSKYTTPTAAGSEAEIFAANKLAFIHPAMRETAGILEQAAANNLPVLIQPSDIRGIIHSHSTWSDGINTIEEMVKAAIGKGYEYLVLSDHSQAAFYANGLTPERIAAQHQEIDVLNQKYAPFRIFKSIEADILYDGSLDYNDRVLETFDIVIASVHSILKMSEEKAMERLLTAIRNPYTTILGHPTGRLLLSREGYPVDHKTIIDACAEHNVVIEINAHPRRLDLDWTWISYALEKGVLLSVDPDAHTISGYNDVFYGVMAAQKGGLTKERNLSSFTLEQMEAFVAAYKAKTAKAAIA